MLHNSTHNSLMYHILNSFMHRNGREWEEYNCKATQDFASHWFHKWRKRCLQNYYPFKYNWFCCYIGQKSKRIWVPSKERFNSTLFPTQNSWNKLINLFLAINREILGYIKYCFIFEPTNSKRSSRVVAWPSYSSNIWEACWISTTWYAKKKKKKKKRQNQNEY